LYHPSRNRTSGRNTIFLFAAALFGQTVLPAFDVANIRINNSGEERSNCDFKNGRLGCTNLQLRVLIARVWTMTPDDELRVMAQTLLKERMALVMDIEQREKSVWALSVSKGEPKLTQTSFTIWKAKSCLYRWLWWTACRGLRRKTELRRRRFQP
jgi:hypothetical protein